MKVFSTFWKIVKKYKVVLLVYIGVTLGVSFIMAAGNGDRVAEVFEDNRQNICIFDEDKSELSIAFCSFMEEKHNIVEIRDDRDALQDALYYDEIAYLIRIPAGFGEGVYAGGQVELPVTSAPNSAGSVYISRQIESFLKTFRAYREMGLDYEEALSKTRDNLSISTEVATLSENIENNTPKFAAYLQMIPYGLVSILIHCIGSVMIAFNDENVAKRTRCSSKSSRSINAQIVFGAFFMAVVVWALFLGITILINGSEFTSHFAFKYFALNAAVCTLAALGLGFLCGVISKTSEAVSILSVSISMVFSFLGGVFVPLSAMGEGIKTVSKFLPTYWYVENCEMLLPLKAMTDAVQQSFMQGIYIQLAFAAATLAIAFCIARNK